MGKQLKIASGRVLAAVESSMTDLSSPGFCLACGDDADGVEPDAERYRCEECGARQVYGAEQVMLIGAIDYGVPIVDPVNLEDLSEDERAELFSGTEVAK